MSDFKLYLAFTKQAEGGLSKSKVDTASSYPVPDGSGYHTNKGITWRTFERYAPILKYQATPKLFYAMPEWIFLGIFEQYWNSAGANLIQSQAVATIIFQAKWGGGHNELVEDLQRYLKANGYPTMLVDGDLGKNTAAAVNKYCATKPKEQKLFDYLYAERLKYLRSLDSYKDNGKGWEDRMGKLYTHALSFINANKTVLGVGFFLHLLLQYMQLIPQCAIL